MCVLLVAFVIYGRWKCETAGKQTADTNVLYIHKMLTMSTICRVVNKSSDTHQECFIM